MNCSPLPCDAEILSGDYPKAQRRSRVKGNYFPTGVLFKWESAACEQSGKMKMHVTAIRNMIDPDVKYILLIFGGKCDLRVYLKRWI